MTVYGPIGYMGFELPGTYLLSDILSRLDNGLDKYDNNPVLRQGSSGWDAGSLRGISPIMSEDGYLVEKVDGIWAYYAAKNLADGGNFQIGLAKSIDGGYTWNKYGNNPVLITGTYSWGYNGITSPCVMQLDDTSYLMMACGITGTAVNTIGIFTSVDGVVWNSQGEKFNAGNFSWDGITGINELGVPALFQTVSGSYVTLLEGSKVGTSPAEWSIFGATSDDTITWTPMNSGLPIFSPTGAGWEDYAVANPRVQLTDDGYFVMIYNGNTGDNPPSWAIGFAYSIDLINWVRYDGNPIITKNTAGWDNSGTETSFLIKEKYKELADKLRFYYQGIVSSDFSFNVGLAISRRI